MMNKHVREQIPSKKIKVEGENNENITEHYVDK